MPLAILTTLRLAFLTSTLLLLLATPLAWWLARGRPNWRRDAVAAMTSLPLILPPTVLGYYLLMAMAPGSPLMDMLGWFGVRQLAFTFPGLVVGSMIFSLPFAIQPLRHAFATLPAAALEAAATLGAGPLDRFISVALPLAKRGFYAAGLLVFAHTIGEFGVVMMIGGSIPGETRVLSVAIYEAAEAHRSDEANMVCGALVIFSFALLFGLARTDRRRDRMPG